MTKHKELIDDLNAVLEKHGWKHRLGDYLEKSRGSQWHGNVVGIYFTELTEEGYALESVLEKNSVQVYPEKALEKQRPLESEE